MYKDELLGLKNIKMIKMTEDKAGSAKIRQQQSESCM